MADFLTNLWESVFTPGTTPTLLIATNATFGCLQLLLFTLLIATYSYHFVALSLICGGLWYAINWFAAELAMAKQEEAAKKTAGEDKDLTTGTDSSQSLEGSTDTVGPADTPTTTGAETTSHQGGMPQVRIRGGPQKIMGVMASAKAAREDSDSLQTPETGADKADMSSSSEWEHVSDSGR